MALHCDAVCDLSVDCGMIFFMSTPLPWGMLIFLNGAPLATSDDGSTINLCDANRSSDGSFCHNAVSGDSYRKEPNIKNKRKQSSGGDNSFNNQPAVTKKQ